MTSDKQDAIDRQIEKMLKVVTSLGLLAIIEDAMRDDLRRAEKAFMRASKNHTEARHELNELKRQGFRMFGTDDFADAMRKVGLK